MEPGENSRRGREQPVTLIAEKDVTDPITAEIIRNALIAITDEMKTNLMRTAYNPIIYEALDYTVGLFDADGDTISIGLGLADVHPRALRCDQGKARVLRAGRDRARATSC